MARKDMYRPGDRIECDMVFVSQAAADLPDGYIKGIASTPRTDLYGHKVLAGAFDESIKTRGLNKGPGIKLLAGHDAQKVCGEIKRLETVGDDLQIEAQFFLDVGFASDLYKVTKHLGGMNFSVGFRLQEFEFVDDDEIENEDDPWILIKKGDLHEVSVVAFPAQQDAQMHFVKHMSLDTLPDIERAMVACRTRSDAKRITQVVKNSLHLFGGPAPAAQEPASKHPLADVTCLQPSLELLAKAKATLSSR